MPASRILDEFLAPSLVDINTPNATLSGGYMAVYKAPGTKNYRIQFVHKGVQYVKSSGTNDLEEAQRMEAELRRHAAGVFEPLDTEYRAKLDYARTMCYSAKQRARRKGIPFDLVPSSIVMPVYCPILNIPLDYTNGPRNDNTPSLDRLVPEHGYVVNNVKVISWKANRLKSYDCTWEDLVRVAVFMRQIESR